ncbi:MAG: hypothetical protein AB1546_04945 [bacterium]
MGRGKSNCRTIFLISIFVFILLILGCGGGEKKGEGKKAGKISGWVFLDIQPATGTYATDTFATDTYATAAFATEEAQAGDRALQFSTGALETLSALLEGAVVRLYEIDASGKTVKPVEGVAASVIDTAGGFTIENAPTNVPNLIVRLEKPDSSPILSAIVPAVQTDPDGTTDVLISPETDMEARIFQEIITTGFSAPADVSPVKVDTLFIKSIVASEWLQATDTAAATAALTADLAALFKDAHKVYSKALTGADKPPTDATLNTITDTLRNLLMEYQLTIEKTSYGGRRPDKEQLSGRYEAIEEAERDALEKITLPVRSYPKIAVLERAFNARKGRIITCLHAETDIEGCPELKTPKATRNEIADALETLFERYEVEYAAWKRAQILNGTAVVSAEKEEPNAAAPLRAIYNLLNVPASTRTFISNAVASDWEDMTQAVKQKDVRQSIGKNYTLWRNIRNYILLTYIFDNMDSMVEMEKKILEAARDFRLVLNNPTASQDYLENNWSEFQRRTTDTFKVWMGVMNTRFPSMPEGDRKKLFWAVRDLFLFTALPDIGIEQLGSADSDGDGVCDAMERDLGTDPLKSTAVPAPPLTATPRSLLPEPPADSDGDGIADLAEISANTNPTKPDSFPSLNELNCYRISKPALCPMPGDNKNNDGDKQTDEEIPDGMDNDGDLLIDEDIL